MCQARRPQFSACWRAGAAMGCARAPHVGQLWAGRARLHVGRPVDPGTPSPPPIDAAGLTVVAEESDSSSFAGFREADRVFFVNQLDRAREFIQRNGELPFMIGLVEGPQCSGRWSTLRCPVRRGWAPPGLLHEAIRARLAERRIGGRVARRVPSAGRMCAVSSGARRPHSRRDRPNGHSWSVPHLVDSVGRCRGTCHASYQSRVHSQTRRE